MTNITFKVSEAAEGGYDARALGHSIFTQGDDLEDLKAMVQEAVLCHFEEDNTPKVIRLITMQSSSQLAVIGVGNGGSQCHDQSFGVDDQMELEPEEPAAAVGHVPDIL